MTAIEMIAQIKGIGLLALVIDICEIRDICGYFIHEHGRHRINGTSVPSVHFEFVKRKKETDVSEMLARHVFGIEIR